ncbi:transposase [Mesorhizobium humile]|uniref:transposase n=1 Tax=Mesorhizobium humile TaxID=3072313 RepID=UPI003D31A729
MNSDGGVSCFWPRPSQGLQLADWLAAAIQDSRNPQRVTHAMADVLRARIFATACGYEDANDLD